MCEWVVTFATSKKEKEERVRKKRRCNYVENVISVSAF